ncbi:MAG: hypothetical protein ACK4NC_07365 [Candidatus Gracilibacteria bacterium]
MPKPKKERIHSQHIRNIKDGKIIIEVPEGKLHPELYNTIMKLKGKVITFIEQSDLGAVGCECFIYH